MPTTFDGVKDGSTLVPCKDATARNDISTINGKIPSAASSSNKLVDTSAMNTAIGNAVSAAYKPAGTKTAAELVSGLLVAANKGNVYNITTAGTTTTDFLEGAGKPIRVGDNVGICEPTSGTFKFDLLSGFVAVDENPTAGSANPVSSGGTKTALDGKVDKVTGKGLSTNDYDNTAKAVVTTAQDNIKANTKLIKDTVGWSGKNVLKNSGTSITQAGVTFTVNADGSVTVNGTATQRIDYNLQTLQEIKDTFLPHIGEKFIINGCPSGGSIPNGFWLNAQGLETDGIGAMDDGSGNGAEFTVRDFSNYQTVGIKISIASGATVNNKTFKPMIRPADILDSTYEPYFGSTAFPRSEQAVLGAKNLVLPNFIANAGGVTTKSGNEYTITTNTNEWSGARLKSEDLILSLSDKGQIKVSFDFKASAANKGTIGTANYKICDNSAMPTEWTYFSTVISGSNPGDVVFYNRSAGESPVISVKNIMFCLATDPDDTYVPYAMTNKELTEKVAANVVDIKTDFKTALMSATGSTVTDVETALLSTYGDLMILNSRINKAANTGINCNVSVPYSVLPKTRGTVYVGLNSPMGAGTASLGGGSLALRYTNSDGATYVDLTVVALMDKS